MIKAQLTALRLALAFLTRIPGAHPEGAGPADFRRAHGAFPLIGLLIGGFIGMVALFLTHSGLAPFSSGVVALAAGALLTGALHEDGLADTADGFGGGHDKASKLAIMRDSRVGTYGGLALVLVTLGKAGAMAQYAGGAVVGCTAVAHAVSRTAATFMTRILPPARDDGLAVSAERPSLRTVAISFAISGAATLTLVPPERLIAVALCAAGVTSLVGLIARRQIGGVTGDVLGATQQLTETMILLALAAGRTHSA